MGKKKQSEDRFQKRVRKLRKNLRQLYYLNRTDFFTYRRAGRGALVGLTIDGIDLVVRKGARDLGVALDSFSGEFDLCARLFEESFDGVIVDAGGFIGTSAIAFSRLYPKATIVVIEPSPSNFAVLKQNIGSHPNIIALEGALTGASTAQTALYDRGTGESGYSIVKQGPGGPDGQSGQGASGGGEGPGRQQVTGISLAQVRERFGAISVLKLDIEGAEKEIFEKSEALLRTIPAVFVELHDRIAPGTSDLFFRLFEDRWIVKDQGEKYLALKK